MRLIIDSHLDLAWSALSWNRDITEDLEAMRNRESHMTDDIGRGRFTVSLPEMRRSRIAVCVATLLARAKQEFRPVGGIRRFDLDHATQDIAYSVAHAQLAYYRLLEERGEIKFIINGPALQQHWKRWTA